MDKIIYLAIIFITWNYLSDGGEWSPEAVGKQLRIIMEDADLIPPDDTPVKM